MKSDRIAGRWIRIAMAMAFGFMNLGHGPIMTFAHAGKHDTASVAAPADHHAGGHHHQAAIDDQSPAATADKPATCNAFGCFITVSPVLVDAPPPAMVSLGKLLPPPLRAGLPGWPEVADPPPRRHA